MAKRSIPAKYKIMIEPVFASPDGHPSIKDLMPVGGTLSDKFSLNAVLDCSVALRFLRVNHNCDPNADHIYCPQSCVHILYARRDIDASEEICVKYSYFSRWTGFNDDDVTSDIISYKTLLRSKWGIACP